MKVVAAATTFCLSGGGRQLAIFQFVELVCSALTGRVIRMELLATSG